VNRHSKYADEERFRRTRNEQKARYRLRTGSSTALNGGCEWTKAEKDAVLRRATSDRELAAELGRSVQAIQVKRTRLLSG